MKETIKFVVFFAAFCTTYYSFCEITSAEEREASLASNFFGSSINMPLFLAPVTRDLLVSGFLDAGVSINPSLPFNGVNFGQLYTDRANVPQLNQLMFTIEKPAVNDSGAFDYALKIQAMYGSDSRIHHVIGETEYALPFRNQLAIVQSYAQLHFPIITNGGFDLRVGQYASYNGGSENIPALENLFYSRSYIYNAGPAQHVGAIGILHLDERTDIYAGLDSGTNTSFGWPGDNNATGAVHAGVTLKLEPGLGVAAFTHIGPENPMQLDPLNVGWPNTPSECACNPNTALRYFNNLTVSFNLSERWKFITDIAYYRDDGWNTYSVSGLSDPAIDFLDSQLSGNLANFPRRARGVNAFGVAQYVTYKHSETLSLNTRVEFWRDANNFFTQSFIGNFANANSIHGFPAVVLSQPLFRNNPSTSTSYLAATIGAYLKLGFPDDFSLFQNLILRPELRYDVAVNHSAPFIGPIREWGRRSQFTVNMDAIVPFTLK